MQNNYIKELLVIKDENLIINKIDTKDKYKICDASYLKIEHKCPKCSKMTSYVFDYRIRKLKHGYGNGYYISINYKRR